MLFPHDTKVDLLKRAPLFADLSKHELEQLAKVSEDMEVVAGRVLCREGEPAQEFFVIIEGEAEATKDGESLRKMGEGDFFGEIALIEDIPRTATVTATAPLRFFVLTRQSFWSMIERMPDVERKVLRALAKRVLDAGTDPTLGRPAPAS
jgi:CRP/FNR family cyclic AMP-dependent transcriptional regulator